MTGAQAAPRGGDDGPGARTLVGIVGGARVASVDARGTVHPERATWHLEWWVGADDRWHLPVREAAVRQSLVEGMPVVHTAMRVPGGDAVQRVFGATGDVAVVEVENASPGPFVAAFVVRGAARVALDGARVFVDGVPALVAARRPSRWAATTDGTIAEIVTSGAARDDPMPTMTDRGARLVTAFLYPVAHRTRLRVAVALGRRDRVGVSELVDPGVLASADDVVRGWRTQLDRGLRVALPDPVLDATVTAARGQLVLAGQAWNPDPEVVAALEDWGFDDEAVQAWQRLGLFGRRRAARRAPGPGAWAEVHRRAPVGAGLLASSAAFLTAVRRALVHEEGGTVDLVPEWPGEWTGLPLDVREVPTRSGRVSFSVRWHGARAALLWEVSEAERGLLQVRASGLDASWVSAEPRGEVLLAPTG